MNPLTLTAALLLSACTTAHGIQFKDADTFTHDGMTYRANMENFDAVRKL